MVKVKALQDVILLDDLQGIRMTAGEEYEMESLDRAVAGERAGYVKILDRPKIESKVETADDPAAAQRKTATKAQPKSKG